MRLNIRSESLLGMVLILCLAAAGSAEAQVDLDRTCATCSRIQNDSLNIKVRAIRLNQAGYRPQDTHKSAFVSQASSPTFTVVSLPDRRVVHTGTLAPAVTHTAGPMTISGFYNSITPMYTLQRPATTEALSRADFSAVTAPGTYVLACGRDTSAAFHIDERIYNHVFETTLKFFGSNRCGKTDSWMHGACHLKDGDALVGAGRAGSLSGGWHDCGDHGKYAPTVGYAAVVLAMTYALFPEKGEDFYGKSYHDTLPFGTDGIPDVLYEAKIGADYILKLYKASKTDGLIARGDMYHSVGTGPGVDHSYWDVPENQDAQTQGRGGPARLVSAQTGANVAGTFAAALAFFAWGWEPFDPAYAGECLRAAIDIYDNLVIPSGRRALTTMPCCYSGQGPSHDDVSLAALGLWFATKQKRYGDHLLTDPALGTNPLAVFNQGEFPAGLMAYDLDYGGPAVGRVYTAGWPTDYENAHSLVLYGLVKLILGDPQKAAAYGVDAATADSLRQDAIVAMRRGATDASSGTANLNGLIRYTPPYNYIYTFDWGFNRYNMGSVLNLFLYWDLTGSEDHYRIAMDNLNYNLGMNPWDISFVMGTGDKNLQHPHNRAANPEGYNAGGVPYKYTSPKGAFMGGREPTKALLDEWRDYTVTETCIDFSAQLLIPTQMLAADIPPDREGPKFRNVNIFPEERTALVAWATDEISRDTLVLLDAPGGRVLQTVPAGGLARNKQANLTGLAPGTTYYVYFIGVDVRGNRTEDRNGGAYWPFTTRTVTVPAQISDVRVCNETHESALVTWWTRNGEYSSRVDYGKTTALGQTREPDDTGIPTRFHRVTVDSLDPATLYYFQVWSGATKDDNGGSFHTFRTTQVLVDYTIRIKPTSKQGSGQGAHFYIDVTNREQVAYTGLELRFYFTADAATAGNLLIRGDDVQLFGGGGVVEGQLLMDYGYNGDRKAVPVPGMPGQWYFPVTIKSTLPVAGRARFDLVITTSANGGSGLQPFSLFRDAWSIRPHLSPPDPVAFGGVDLTKGETGVYTDPEEVIPVNGVPTLTYVETPYITAYYRGVHVYGYGPDYQTDRLVQRRVMSLSLTQPVASPLDRLDLRQENGGITVSGRASSDPDGRVDHVIVNGETLPESQLVRAPGAGGGAVTFSRPYTLVEGANVFDIIAWDTANCAVESRKLIVNWTKGPPQPPPKVATPAANPPGSAGRDSLVVGLSTATPGAAIWYTLDGKDPVPGAAGATLYAGPIVIRNQATLKAIAVKADHTPSDILTETYDVFPFKVANIRTASLVDADADGHADAISVSLDTALGAPSEAVAGAQVRGASLTSGLVAGAPVFAGATLRIPLAPNTLWVRDGAETLTVPPPAALQDGMLRPGTYRLRDSVAPVLRRALYAQAAPVAAGVPAPDTLIAAFSEPLRLVAVGPRPFTALRLPDSLGYDFVLGPGAPAALPGLRPGETAYRFPITSTPAAVPPAAAAPQAGDWVWILPGGNVSDTVGNVQANPANVRVPLQVRVALVQSVRGVAPEGFSRLPPGEVGKPWSVYGGPNLTGTVGDPGSALPVVLLKPDPVRSAGLVIESTLPFAATVRVHTSLGGYVGKVRLKVSDRDFALLQAGAAPGSRRLELLWNGRADNGHAAGTGAYIFMWSVTYFPADQAPASRSGKSRFGIVRQP